MDKRQSRPNRRLTSVIKKKMYEFLGGVWSLLASWKTLALCVFHHLYNVEWFVELELVWH